MRHRLVPAFAMASLILPLTSIAVPIENSGIPPSSRWQLEGSSSQMKDTVQCDLQVGIAPFERLTGYMFSMSATKKARILEVFYDVDTTSLFQINKDARATLAFSTENRTLTSYAASLYLTPVEGITPTMVYGVHPDD